jgi:hypothetical protein
MRRLGVLTSNKRLFGTAADRARGGHGNRAGCYVWLTHTLLVVP